MSRLSLVYFLLSVVVILSGAVLLLASDSEPSAAGEQPVVYDPVLLSIATSLIAAGAGSMLFTIVREIDQRDADRDAERSSQGINRLIELAQELHQGLTQLRRSLLITQNPDTRRIYSTHPVREVQHEIDDAADQVRLDGLGLALKALYQEQVKKLIERGNCEVRLLVVDPCSDAFAIMCDEEARGLVAMTEDVVAVTEEAQRWAVDHDDAARHDASVLVKWSTRTAPVTMTRVNDWMVVRARFPREGTGERPFFEQYTTDDERAFLVMERLFTRVWEEAKEPTAEDLQRARTHLETLVEKARRDDQVQ